MPAFAAVLATAVLGALAVFQLALVFGAPLGHFAWGGKHRVLSARLRVGSALSVVLYAAIALVLLARAGLMPSFDDGFVFVASWIIFAYFALGIPMNGISRSKPERYTMAPVCLVLAACSLVVALA